MENCYLSVFNNETKHQLCENLYKKLNGEMPIFICIGSDLVVGDSLGPLVGTFLKERKLSAYIYGTLNFPITSKEIEYAKKYIHIMHKNAKVVAIDSALGNENDIGNIKVTSCGIKPGLGVKKDLDYIGDVGIMGIVSNRSNKNINLYNFTRLNLVYKIATIIADSIELYINNYIKRCVIENNCV